MRLNDHLNFAWQVVRGSPGRTFMILLAMGIGVAAVVAVTALGEGARLYVVNQFGSLGTNLVIVLPGRSETAGAMPGVLIGRTPRDLTLEDALALKRSRAVRRVAPLIVGAGDVRVGARRRETPVLGSTAVAITTKASSLVLRLGANPPSSPTDVLYLLLLSTARRLWKISVPQRRASRKFGAPHG
jgi:putative ABC transport system permease protein